MHYAKNFKNYINKYNLNFDTPIDEQLRTIGVVNFFNEITISCLGEPVSKFPITKDKISSVLLYSPAESKNTHIHNFDIIYIDRLYAGILTNGLMKYNYAGYENFIINLFNLRKELKQHNDLLLTYIIKYYLNSIYGVLNKPNCVLTSELYNPRNVISKHAKEIISNLANCFLKADKPIYYIRLDKLYIADVNKEEFDTIYDKFKSISKHIFNFDVSGISHVKLVKNSVLYIDKKPEILNDYKDIHKINNSIDNANVLNTNKIYFNI